MACLEIIDIKNPKRWNIIVRRMEQWDVYYLCEYAISMQKHGDGDPLLLYYNSENVEMCYVVMKKDISKSEPFRDVLPDNQLFDLETPYGYGGPLKSGHFDEDEQTKFAELLVNYCKRENIVSQFIRFHPMLDNFNLFSQITELKYLKDTIYIDTSRDDNILENIKPRNRTKIRKAIKSGVTVLHDKGERLEEFIEIYQSTMDTNGASEYYYFDRQYYEYIIANMSNNTEFFYSFYEGEMIGAAIFFYTDSFMHYHLSGSLKKYKGLAFTDLLFYEAAMWANKRGIRSLHLGGGIEADDSLFCFKKQFNKDGNLPFYIGRTIFDQKKYEMLLSLRYQNDTEFKKNNGFLIAYRK